MRKIYVDFLRFLALFYMFFQHSVLALLAPQDNSGIIFFLYELVPFCPALFLFLSGYSTTLKYEKDANFILDNKYLFRAVKKGGILILSSMLLFFVEHGFQIPDIFIASGILNSIGWMIIISTLILKTKPKKTFFLLLIITLLALTVIFEKIGFFFIPFNYGYEPTSPTIIYGFIGVFWGLLLISLKNEKTKNIFVVLFGVSGGIILIFYALKYGFGRIFHSDIGRYEVVRRFDFSFLPQSIFFGSKESGFYTAKIWNYNTECMIASFGAVAFLFASFFFLESFFQKKITFFNFLFLPGKYAFVNYFYHLFVIGLFVTLFDFGVFNSFEIIAFILALFIVSYLISFIAEKILVKKSALST